MFFLLLQLHTLLMLFSVLWQKCEQQNWAVLASSWSLNITQTMTARGCAGRLAQCGTSASRTRTFLANHFLSLDFERHWRHELPPNHWNERFAMNDKFRRHVSSGSAPDPPACEKWVGGHEPGGLSSRVGICGLCYILYCILLPQSSTRIRIK